jgi:hypothetical protein
LNEFFIENFMPKAIDLGDFGKKPMSANIKSLPFIHFSAGNPTDEVGLFQHDRLDATFD